MKPQQPVSLIEAPGAKSCRKAKMSEALMRNPKAPAHYEQGLSCL